MKISKLTTPKKQWFPYPDDQDGARFEFTLLTPKQEREINKRAQKFIASDAGGSMEFDPATASNMRASMALTDCENVYSDEADTKESKLTETLKRKLFDEVDGFETWAIECYAKLRESCDAEAEAERKNSSTSAIG